MILSTILSAQNQLIDSLQLRLQTTGNDSLRSLLCIQLAYNYSGYDTSRTLYYLEKGRQINNRYNWNYNKGYYYQCYANYLFERGYFYNKSLQYADTAIGYFKKCKDGSFRIAEVTMIKGSVLNAMGRAEDAIKKYHESLHLFEVCDNPDKIKKIAELYNNIATVFFLMNQYQKGLEYDLRSIPFHIAAKNDEMLAYAYTYVASDYMRLKQYDSADKYFNMADPLVKKLNKNSVNIEYYGKIGEMYWWKNDWASTRKYYTIAYENARQINNLYNIIEYLWGIAACYYNEKNYEEADKYLLRAKELTEKNQLQHAQREMYAMLSQNYSKLKKYKLAYEYHVYYNGLKDSVANAALNQKIAEMDELYQSQKRQQTIVQLEKDKQIQALAIREKSMLNYILIGSVGVLIIVGLLWRKLSKKHDELQLQQIRELQKDRQLVAVDSMLKGQEEERSRLARDLHDGLGGLLSGVKFSLSNMKEHLLVTPDNMAVFERSLDMLDTSIKELRRVAHNMMPEMLTKFGLDEALKEYCNSINSAKLLTVSYQSHGMDERIGKSAEIIIYRIVQELLNNILKHAAASAAFVQLVKEETRLNVIVEDDGKGFDAASEEQRHGAGLMNVRSRVEYLKGHLEIHSEAGKGTLINIEFNLQT